MGGRISKITIFKTLAPIRIRKNSSHLLRSIYLIHTQAVNVASYNNE